MISMNKKEVTVNKDNLLEILKKNRISHESIYKEACLKYKSTVLQELNKAIDDVQQGKVDLNKGIVVTCIYPENYLKYYDEIIEMLELSVDSNITLDSDSFRAFVKDEWSWKSKFTLSNSKYLGS